MKEITDVLRKVRAVLASRGTSADELDDVVQEAFVRFQAYTRDHQVRSPEAFLVTTAVNIARDAARRARSSPVMPGSLSLDIARDFSPLPDELYAAQERLQRLNEGLNRLKPEVRLALLAQRIDGLSYAQIASREGISVCAVEKRIARAVEFLIDWMDGW